MMTNCHLNTTVVAIFPNVCLRRRIEPPSYARTAYVVVIWPSFLLDAFVKIWATWKIFLGKWFTARPGKKFLVRLCLFRRLNFERKEQMSKPKQLTTPENTMTYHNALCLSPHFNSQEKLKTILMQNFGVTNKEHYGMSWYFLEWSIAAQLCRGDYARALELINCFFDISGYHNNVFEELSRPTF